MELYVLRHGMTTANKEKIAASRMEGYYDDLTKEGVKQAHEILPKLSIHKFDVIIISPLKRTTQTIQPYLDSLKIKPKVIVLDMVSERELGDLAGITMEELGKIKKSSGFGTVEWIPPNGESQFHVLDRAKKFIEYLRKNYNNNSKILLCSHTNFLRTLDIFLTGRDISEFPKEQGLKNGELKKYII